MPQFNFLQSKFGKDLSWSFVSFVVLGVSGILLNIVIARFYDASTLGVFNQVFALYIFITQFAVFGLQYSVLKFVSQHASDRNKCNPIISAGLLGTAFVALFFTLLAWLLTKNIGQIFNSVNLEKSFYYILPGIWFFALNKVLFNILNGYRAMRILAVTQSLRFILILIGVMLIIVLDYPGVMLPLSITLAEAILFIVLLIFTRHFFTFSFNLQTINWMRTHAVFGLRGVLSGTIAEMNSRADILMLGFFLSDKAVGIYSLASMLAEGMAQLAVVLRNNVNPLITQYLAQNRLSDLKALTHKVVYGFYGVMLLVAIAAVLAFPWVVQLLIGGGEFELSWLVFAILSAGIVLSAGYLPLEMFLVQAGKPTQQTYLKGLILSSNILLNAILIPLFGLVGAAVATAVAFVLSVVYLKLFVSRWTRISI